MAPTESAMLTLDSRPGKTAPRLIEDLLRYDARREASYGRNILTDPPPHFNEAQARRPAVPPGSCRHAHMIKYNQSVIPALDERPNNSTVYKIAAYCQACRYHVDLIVDFRGSPLRTRPCPNQDFPLHHFVCVSKHVDNHTSPGAGSSPALQARTYDFACTAEQCPASLKIRIKPPNLQTEDIRLLTNGNNLRARFQNTKIKGPDRPDLKVAQPIEVLDALAIYIRDSLEPRKRKGRISMYNRRFMLSFGEDCDNLLGRLGFSQAYEEELDETFWYLPKPTAPSDPWIEGSDRAFLEDVGQELMALINNRPNDEKLTLRNLSFQPQPALKEFERSLGSLGYERVETARRNIDLTQEEHPYYAGLGAVGDFSDNLLIYAYDRQATADPSNIAYYFDCLQDLAKGRKSEALQMKVAMLLSEGVIGRSDEDRAYKYFSIDPRHAMHITDEHILGTFHSRLADVPTSQVAEMREMLRTLGQARNSESLRQAASGTIETYEQALLWLGADASTADDFIIAMYSAKSEGDKNTAEIGRKAVQIITDARNSDGLRNWLISGETGQSKMDLAEAYKIFQLDDRTQQPDTEMLMETLRIHKSDQPANAARFQEAFDLLVAQSSGAGSQSANGMYNGSSKRHPPDQWPVGLQNIGNTCYLNSLLQFYFTVKPLRDLVLDFDNFRMEITPENIQNKRVGGRKITAKEAEKAQDFVYALQELFQSMITETGDVSRPTVKLASLTLAHSGEENTRRRSTISGDRPINLGELNGAPIVGPLPQIPENVADNQPSSKANLSNEASEDSSEATLIGDTVATPESEDHEMPDLEEQKKALDEKENLVPNKDEVHEIHADGTELKPLAPASPSRLNQQHRRRDSFADDEGAPMAGSGGKQKDQPKSTDLANSPPSRPPPVPPRPKQESEAEQSSKPEGLKGAEKFSQQQDVTEAIDNVLFLLECAIKPSAADGPGQGMNLIKDLFYGSSIWTYLKGSFDQKEESFNDLQIDLTTGPSHIYAALDRIFDKHSVELDGKMIPRYRTLNRTPPMLQIRINRVDYDIVKKQTVKTEHHLDLEEVIYMDRYEDMPDSDLMERRKRSWTLKEKARKYETRRDELAKTQLDMTLPEAMNAAADYVASMQAARRDSADPMDANPQVIDGDLVQQLRQEASDRQKEMEACDAAIKDLTDELSTLFTGFTSHAYRLHSLFFHRGTSGAGHYWIYIHDFARNIWRKYNDEHVDEVTNLDEIFKKPEGTYRATPYLLVYVRDDRKEELVDALLRQPIREASPEVEMRDSGVEVIEGVDPSGTWDSGDEEDLDVEDAAALKAVEEMLDAAAATYDLHGGEVF